MTATPTLTLADLKRLHGTFTNYVIWLAGTSKSKNPSAKMKNVKALWEKIGQVIEHHELAGSQLDQVLELQDN